jgi:site-specific recombinase XerD
MATYTKIAYRIVFNHAKRLNRQQEGLIQIECLLNSRRVYFSTHIHVKPSQFVNGRVVEHPLADDYNYTLYKQKLSIEKIELDFIKRGIYPTLEMLKHAVNESTTPSAKFIDFGKQVVQASERKQLTKSGYDTLFNNIEKFRKGILVSEIDYTFITKYDAWLKNCGLAHNTRVGRLRQMKAILNEAIKRDVITKNPFDMFKIPPMNNKKGFVDVNGVKRLENLVLSGKEDQVRDAFLFCCYCGLRFSDFIRLKTNDINNGWISKEMHKVKAQVEIPISEVFDGKALKIIEKYGTIENLSSNIGCNATVNKTLKNIFRKAKIEGNFTFHTSRHTFASLLLQMGVPITSVQKMLGHKKLSTTQIYGEVNKDTISKDLKKVLKKVRKAEVKISVEG